MTLVAGTNGAGKSHLLSLFELMGEKQDFLVSVSTQDVANKVALNRPDLVYHAIIKNVRSRSGDGDAVGGLLRPWMQRAIPVLENASMNMGQFYKLRDAGLLPEHSPPRTTLCLLLYVWSLRLDQPETTQLALSALRGEQVTNTALCEAAAGLGLDPGRIGYTPSAYKSEFWFGQLSTLLFIAHSVGVAGVLIILDEIESLLDLGRSSSKRRAYSEMTALFGNAYGLPRTWLVLAYTPAFLVGLERDQVADAAFREALAAVRRTSEVDLPPQLSARDAECLVRRVRSLVEIADGSAVRLPDPATTVARWSRTSAPTRELVRIAVEEAERAASAASRPFVGLEPASETALRRLAERFGRR